MSEFLTLQQVAEALKVSVQSVRDWTLTGFQGIVLQSKPAGRRKVVRPEWVDQFQADIANRKASANLDARKPVLPGRSTNAKVRAGQKRHGMKTATPNKG